MRALNRLVAKGLVSLPAGKHADGGNLWFIKRPDGGAQWVLRIDVLGRRREMGLGAFPEVTLREAREEAAKWRAIARSGVDPVSERERQRTDAAAALAKSDPTLEEYTRRVFEGIKAGLRGDGVRGRWLSPLEQHVFPKIGKRRLSSIHQTDIVETLRPIWQTKHPTAIKAIQRLGVVFTKAKLARLEADPFIVDAARDELGQVRHRTKGIAATPWQEIPALYRRLDADLYSHLALRWIILTAVRSESARGARFDEIDGDVWTVPAERMKAREGKAEPFRVPLSRPALELLERLREGNSSPFLFPSSKKSGQHLTDVALSKVLNGLEEAGRIHGFRTSFRTWCQDTGAPFDVAETALAHTVGGKVERSYARSDLLDQRRTLMAAWAGYVIGGSGNIVQLSHIHRN